MYSRSSRVSRYLNTVAATCLILSIAGCGHIDTAGVDVRPTRHSLAEKEPPQSTTMSGAPAPSTAQPKDKQEPEAQGSMDGSALPTVLHPDNSEVALTPPGAVLRFGEEATVVTSDSEGRFLVWRITAHDAVPIPHERVELLNPARAESVRQFSCFAYDITFLGTDIPTPPDPLVLYGVADTVHTSVPVPTVVPTNRQGDVSQRVVGGADNACGIPESDRIPATANLLEVGRSYARGAVEAFPADEQPRESDRGALYLFDKGVLEASGSSTSPAPIRWN